MLPESDNTGSTVLGAALDVRSDAKRRRDRVTPTQSLSAVDSSPDLLNAESSWLPAPSVSSSS